MASLRAYLGVQGIEIEWESLEDLDNEALVTSLAMACPFDPQEKQAMLEADSVEERGRALTALLEMGSIAGDRDGAPTH
jgi:Lon protease-like protein